MKKHLFFILAAAALLLTACNESNYYNYREFAFKFPKVYTASGDYYPENDVTTFDFRSTKEDADWLHIQIYQLLDDVSDVSYDAWIQSMNEDVSAALIDAMQGLDYDYAEDPNFFSSQPGQEPYSGVTFHGHNNNFDKDTYYTILVNLADDAKYELVSFFEATDLDTASELMDIVFGMRLTE